MVEVERAAQFLALAQNIPAGIYSCFYDELLTFACVSDSFLSLVKYSRADILEKFDDKLLNLICKEDRARVLATAAEQLCCGKTAQCEYRVICGDGKTAWVYHKGNLVKSEQGSDELFCVAIEISDRKAEMELLVRQAQSDALTGLYNKGAVATLANEHLRSSQRGDETALMMIDIDNFKLVNDSFGHICGDNILTEISDTLKASFRQNDIIGRIGGDEFLVFLRGVTNKEAIGEKAEKLICSLRKIKPDCSRECVSCSIGIAFLPNERHTFHQLYRYADEALYDIKNSGKDGFAFYDRNRRGRA